MEISLQARIHTCFHRFTKIGQIFHNKYFLIKKNTFQAKIWPISRLNDSETQERALKGVKIQENSWESLSPEPPRLLDPHLLLRLWMKFSVVSNEHETSSAV